VQSVPITTKVASPTPAHDEAHWIQHYMKKLVRDLQKLRGFLRILTFTPQIKLTAAI